MFNPNPARYVSDMVSTVRSKYTHYVTLSTGATYCLHLTRHGQSIASQSINQSIGPCNYYNIMLHPCENLKPTYSISFIISSFEQNTAFSLPRSLPHFKAMMTSSNGNIFRVTGHLCGEFTGLRWIPHTTASDAELWCFLWSASE